MPSAILSFALLAAGVALACASPARSRVALVTLNTEKPVGKEKQIVCGDSEQHQEFILSYGSGPFYYAQITAPTGNFTLNVEVEFIDSSHCAEEVISQLEADGSGTDPIHQQLITEKKNFTYVTHDVPVRTQYDWVFETEQSQTCDYTVRMSWSVTCGGGPSPAPPSPPSPPSPPAAGPYEDPNAGSCGAGEQAVQITGVAGSFCSPKCTGILVKKCPAFPGQITAQPKCVLETAGSKKPSQCALICDPSAADDACPAKASCKAIQTTGLCTYDT